MPVHHHLNLRLGGLLLAWLFSLAGPSHAGAPLATDDAGVLDYGNCEAEIYGARLRTPGQGHDRSSSSQLSCGVAGDVQAALAYGRQNQAGGIRNEALAISAKKLVLVDEQLGSFALSAGAVAVRGGGGGFRYDSVSFNGIVSRQLAPGFTGHANLGWAHSQADHNSSTTWNLALESALDQSATLGAEVYGDDSSRPWLAVGLRFAALERLTLGASYATRAGPVRQRLTTAGATFAF